MKIEIELENYLNEEEIKEECKMAIRDCIYQKYQKESDLERLISNLSYKEVFKMVNDCIDEDLETLLKIKCKEIIEDLSAYTVFRAPDVFNREPSKAYIILQKVIADSMPLIEQRVASVIDEYNFNGIKDNIGDAVHQCIMDRLFRESEEE